ncbi:maestro heat-like repeat family member 5 isoform X8 [Peromyscus maniculatus bairdii]|uniref:maestro heat-like repeat family member 5 isoform X8 n=1 Tax=Peromyscus maniculatus bairdii TaxID=230844 RepID=UPI003FD18DDD
MALVSPRKDPPPQSTGRLNAHCPGRSKSWSLLWEKQKESHRDASVKKLLEFLSLDPKEAADKAILFHLYGLILRECTSEEQVQCHLASLLELSHQHSSQREGIALAVGLASTKHLQEVWALLEHLGRTKFLRSAAVSPDSQPSDNHLRWKWVSSTSLLCYGQIAKHIKKDILPWVDNIASRMVYYYSCGPCDEILKSSFLSAAILLTRSLRDEHGAQRYKFTQIPELVQCLLGILQKEPNFLTTFSRQKVILVIVGLSNLRPRLTPLLKSQVLKTCLHSVYKLPSTEALKSGSPSLERAPDIMVLYKKTIRALDLLLQNFIAENPSMDEVCFLLQHTEHWLNSDKSHERCRAVQSIFLLLQYVVDSLKLAEEAVPSILGHQIGLLTLLWRDKDESTQQHSHHCVFLLMQLVFQQKGKLEETSQWSKMTHFEIKSREWEEKLYHMVKAFKKDLTVAQHTQLILTLVHNLGSGNYLRGDLAAQLLLMMCEEPGFRKEQVAELLQGLFQELPNIHSRSIQQTISKATMALGIQHTQEVVEVVLSLCHPSERWILLLWKALATNYHLSRDVITLLYIKLKLRPPRKLLQSKYQAHLVSLMALGTIYELLYTPEYRNTVRWAFAGILLGLLTELYYLLEMGLVQGIFDYQEDNIASKPLGPCRTCLEALKGLFWTNQYWEVFADLKLTQAWELFGKMETFTRGVTLLARAMAHYNCEVKAVLGQALISLKSTEERDNIVGICIITEFLNSPDVFQYVSRKVIDNSLSMGLSSRNRTVRAMSLQGLGSTLMHPNKERAKVRECAIFLFGDVIHYGGKKFHQSLKILAFQATVPLLFHMADPCPEVAMKAKFTFLRCAILLKWEFRKELFGKLAWGQGLGAANDIFVYMIESNFGNYQQFLSQALMYLDSPHKALKGAAMRFIGALLQDYFSDLCFYLTKDDVIILKNYLEALSHDPDSRTRRFYLNHWDDVVELSHYVMS